MKEVKCRSIKAVKDSIKNHRDSLTYPKIPYNLKISTGTFSMVTVSIDVSNRQFMDACHQFINGLKREKRKGYITLYLSDYFISGYFCDDGKDGRFKQ